MHGERGTGYMGNQNHEVEATAEQLEITMASSNTGLAPGSLDIWGYTCTQ